MHVQNELLSFGEILKAMYIELALVVCWVLSHFLCWFLFLKFLFLFTKLLVLITVIKGINARFRLSSINEHRPGRRVNLSFLAVWSLQLDNSLFSIVRLLELYLDMSLFCFCYYFVPQGGCSSSYRLDVLLQFFLAGVARKSPLLGISLLWGLMPGQELVFKY